LNGANVEEATTDLGSNPEPEALAAVRDALAPGGRVGRVRRLRGGVSSGMHAVELFGADGARRWVVLRRFGDYRLENDPTVCQQEWRVLQLLERHAVPAARPLWLDAAGTVCGRPALVTTLLPGRPQLAPPDVAAWARGLARAIAAVHLAPIAAADLDFLTDQGSHLDRVLSGEPSAEALAHPGGAAAWAALRHGWPRVRRHEHRLVHGDYWPGNTVWHRGRLTGIVDWEQSRRGDPIQDVGCCRHDLALLARPGAADQFLAAYEAAAGPAPNLWFWDLHVATTGAFSGLDHWLEGYRDLGRTDLTMDVLRARRDAFIASALSRAP
jgi:aminoglycoside phosphotransferase (APT) family kinase protein